MAEKEIQGWRLKYTEQEQDSLVIWYVSLRKNAIPWSTETLQYQLHKLRNEFDIHFP